MNKESDYSKVKIKKVQDSYKKLVEDLNREPLPEEIAVDLCLEVDEVRQLLNYRIEEDNEEQDFELKYKLTIKNYELEKRRLALGLTQEQVANKLNLGSASYSQIESCRNFPNTDRQIQIAKILGSSVDILFPEWLKIFTPRWSESDKSRIVPVSQLRLNNPMFLSLESGSVSEMERMTDNEIIKKILLETIAELQPREQQILRMRFGIGDKISHTLDEVSKEFGTTRERIRQIEFKALDKLRMNPRIQLLNKV